MRMILTSITLLCVAAAGSGCTSDQHRRADTITDGVGNAQAANTVMQMVDPWQDGVQNTHLLVPAARAAKTGPAESAASAKDAQSLSN
ncbi:MAG: hypothetical protein KKB66_08530 [Alphaproteobacteria bacterium]|jgi:hypothetical protein|nr:hypothetical protein [Alphaproteobacteria bacterium]MBU0802623.1 hypothetical protein [Alphaproteobacteria bacterium]MBU0871420.1 hypothetical protein [Alphaproteobacteria bacterium]MBU1400087.1 hypothetical protein [Alphaproteobacteria bacterium]MBU1591207.1 hypothetical protein [Alphaproteobacteria bacterium]